MTVSEYIDCSVDNFSNLMLSSNIFLQKKYLQATVITIYYPVEGTGNHR